MINMSKTWFVAGISLAMAAPGLISCSHSQCQHAEVAPTTGPAVEEEAHQHTAPQVSRAVAVLNPTAGNDVRGVVTFLRTEGGVYVVAEVRGLTPGPHGFHVHQLGDCSAPDGTSAGGHFNPTGHDHGGPDSEVRHVGDLGNIVADAEGNARHEVTDSQLQLDGPHSIVGRGLIVHAGEDDLASQPTGAAGARVACGVIGVDANE